MEKYSELIYGEIIKIMKEAKEAISEAGTENSRRNSKLGAYDAIAELLWEDRER